MKYNGVTYCIETDKVCAMKDRATPRSAPACDILDAGDLHGPAASTIQGLRAVPASKATQRTYRWMYELRSDQYLGLLAQIAIS